MNDSAVGTRVDLLTGERLQLADVSGQMVLVVNADDYVVGVFQNPTYQTEAGVEKAGRFIVDGNVISVVPEFELGKPIDQATPDKVSWRSRLAKWSYRTVAGMTCVAVGAGTGLVGGFVCGLGTAAIEDFIGSSRLRV